MNNEKLRIRRKYRGAELAKRPVASRFIILMAVAFGGVGLVARLTIDAPVVIVRYIGAVVAVTLLLALMTYIFTTDLDRFFGRVRAYARLTYRGVVAIKDSQIEKAELDHQLTIRDLEALQKAYDKQGREFARFKEENKKAPETIQNLNNKVATLEQRNIELQRQLDRGRTRGQGLVEYGPLILLIAIITVAVLSWTGHITLDMFHSIVSGFPQ